MPPLAAGAACTSRWAANGCASVCWLVPASCDLGAARENAALRSGTILGALDTAALPDATPMKPCLQPAGQSGGHEKAPKFNALSAWPCPGAGSDCRLLGKNCRLGAAARRLLPREAIMARIARDTYSRDAVCPISFARRIGRPGPREAEPRSTCALRC